MARATSSISLTLTPGSPTAYKSAKDDDGIDSKRARFLNNYADAFTDTNGAAGGTPFIYKNGHSWPKPPEDQEAKPYIREMRPVAHAHPIVSSWEGILTSIETYLDEHEIKFTIIAGLSYANSGDRMAFCQLVVVIGVPPMNFEFEKVKAAADDIKRSIIDEAGFSEIPIAFREWEVRMGTGTGPKLPALEPLMDEDITITEFRHPFTSTLGLAIALEKKPHIEGTVGLFLHRSRDSDDLLALTCAHVICFPHATKGLTITESGNHHENIIALGTRSYGDSINAIKSRIGALNGIFTSEQDRIRQIDEWLAEGKGSRDALAKVRLRAQQRMDMALEDAGVLDVLHGKVTKELTLPKDRHIGRILCADPIGPSSDEPDAHTVDWAAILLREDAFKKDEFQGNKVWIGKIPQGLYCELMWPNPGDRQGYRYPENGLLQIYDSVPEPEMIMPKQLNAHGDPVMPVVKNGRTTGTTVGWLNGLKSKVRYYKVEDGVSIEFKSLETTFIPYGTGYGAFSEGGDSGSVILDRMGRIVAILTGGGGCGGLADSTDVTFGTPWYQLFPHVKEALPSCFVL